MKLSKRQLKRIIREAIRTSWKDPHSRNRRNKEQKQVWYIMCDWTKHPNPKKHYWGEQVYAEHFGTKAEAEYQAKQESKEIGIPMWVEEGNEDMLYAEAKFTAHGPLDREGMQIALGIHDDQLNPKPDEGLRSEMVDYVSFHEDGTIDDTLPANRFVDFFEDYWNDVAQHHGLQTWPLDDMKLAFDSLVEDGTLVLTDGMVSLA